MLYNVYSAVTVEWACLVCLLLCKEEGSSSVAAFTERSDMGMYEVSLCMSVGFWG